MRLNVSLPEQCLRVLDDGGAVLRRYTVSTARNGAGERNGSERTPRGEHFIRARIGAGCPVNTVFRGRRPTGEIFSPELRRRHPGRDWILTRILWLCGAERGINRGGDVDTQRRYIYIHGAPDDDRMGVPGSHGCIKMANRDVLELFAAVAAGTRVTIHE